MDGLELFVIPPPFSRAEPLHHSESAEGLPVALPLPAPPATDELDDLAAILLRVRRRRATSPVVAWLPDSKADDLLALLADLRVIGFRAAVHGDMTAGSLRGQLCDLRTYPVDLERWARDVYGLEADRAAFLRWVAKEVCNGVGTLKELARLRGKGPAKMSREVRACGFESGQLGLAAIVGAKRALRLQRSDDSAEALARDIGLSSRAMRHAMRKRFGMSAMQIRRLLGFEPLLANALRIRK